MVVDGLLEEVSEVAGIVGRSATDVGEPVGGLEKAFNGGVESGL